MAVEYSEIMTAAAMFYSNRELDFYTKDADSLLEWLKDAHKTISNLQNIRYGANKNQFIDYVDQGRWARLQKLSDDNRKKYLTNAVQGISAAKAIRKWLSSEHGERVDAKAEKVYITGNKWPKPVDKFQVKAYGFDDYNSSDIIIKTRGLNFYGVSLKKKPKDNSADPTLINKAFDSILGGAGPGGVFTKIKNEIQSARAEYFAGVVREAVKKNIISIDESILNQSDLKLWTAKDRDKARYPRAYIDIKGNNSDGYETDPKNCKMPAMKDFVNEGLAKPDNLLWKKFSDVVEGNGKIFADSLINLVLKVNLTDEIAAKNLPKYNFGFALVTGVGNLTKVRGSKPAKYAPNVGQGKAIDMHTILCGLRKLSANKEEYKIAVDFDKKEIADAAKIFFKISKAGVPILDLELRYKGSFTPQPQFFANITPEFKDIMTKECLVEAK